MGKHPNTIPSSALLRGTGTVLWNAGNGVRIAAASARSSVRSGDHPFRMTANGAGLTVAPGIVFFNCRGHESNVVHVERRDDGGARLPDLDFSQFPAGEYAVLACAVTSDLDGPQFRLFAVDTAIKDSSVGVLLPGFCGLFIGSVRVEIKTGEDGGEIRTCSVLSQSVSDNIELAIPCGYLSFLIQFSAEVEASHRISDWTCCDTIQTSISASVGYDADPRESIGEYLFSGTLAFPYEINALYLVFKETLVRDIETGRISRSLVSELPEVAAGASSAEPPEVVYTVSGADANSFSAIIRHKILAGIFLHPDDAVPVFTPSARPPLKIGGFTPDDWLTEGSSTNDIWNILRVSSAETPAKVECWSNLAAYAAGTPGGSGRLYLLGSNFTDPLRVGDVLLGHCESGISDFIESFSGGSRTWQFSVERPFDCAGNDPAPIYVCGALFLYRAGAAWHIFGNFGAAKVGDTVFPGTLSGFNGARYYQSGEWYLWSYEGIRVLTKSLGGGMEESDAWYREDEAGTLAPHGTASTAKSLQFGYSGLTFPSDAPTPPNGNWTAADLGSENISVGARTFAAQPPENAVFVADKRSFL